MLIEFTVGNFRSFKEPITLSMVAAKLTARDTEVNTNNTFQATENLTLLTSTAIYGANASGKSNLVQAFGFMRWFVKNSSRETQVDDPIDTIPFRLDTLTVTQPSFFEVVFRLEDISYRYGFEVTRERVETEWLFYSPHGKEAKLFTREGNNISTSPRAYKGGETLKSLTRPNALFLSVSAQFNNEIAIRVLGWFNSVNVISGLDDSSYRGFTAHKFSKDATYRTKILDLIRDSDVGIHDVETEKVTIDDIELMQNDLPSDMRDFLLNRLKEDEEKLIIFKTIHDQYCENGILEKVTFDLGEESEGTQKLFHLSGPIINTLLEGKTLIIDEIEARMHTLLTRKLISLFNSEQTNPNHAQLIFATHDTNLLTNKLFRRDQIWFVEKDEFGASRLYSLAELKIRNDRSFENDYLQGRYGGVPVLGEMRQLVIGQGLEEIYEEH